VLPAAIVVGTGAVPFLSHTAGVAFAAPPEKPQVKIGVGGDSTVSGEGADGSTYDRVRINRPPNTTEDPAHRARNAPARQAVRQLQEENPDLTIGLDFGPVTGADRDSLSKPTRPGTPFEHPPQLNSFKDADIGIIGIGANDANFTGWAKTVLTSKELTTARAFPGFMDVVTSPKFLADQVDAYKAALHEMAPGSELLVLNYAYMLDANVPARKDQTDQKAAWEAISSLEGQLSLQFTAVLNAVIKEAARIAGEDPAVRAKGQTVTLVDQANALDGHRMFSPKAVRGVNGIKLRTNNRLSFDYQGSFHPNDLGQSLLAQRLLPQLREALTRAKARAGQGKSGAKGGQGSGGSGGKGSGGTGTGGTGTGGTGTGGTGTGGAGSGGTGAGTGGTGGTGTGTGGTGTGGGGNGTGGGGGGTGTGTGTGGGGGTGTAGGAGTGGGGSAVGTGGGGSGGGGGGSIVQNDADAGSTDGESQPGEVTTQPPAREPAPPPAVESDDDPGDDDTGDQNNEQKGDQNGDKAGEQKGDENKTPAPGDQKPSPDVPGKAGDALDDNNNPGFGDEGERKSPQPAVGDHLPDPTVPSVQADPNSPIRTASNDTADTNTGGDDDAGGAPGGQPTGEPSGQPGGQPSGPGETGNEGPGGEGPGAEGQGPSGEGQGPSGQSQGPSGEGQGPGGEGPGGNGGEGGGNSPGGSSPGGNGGGEGGGSD
jgi:hypothetical protein